MPVQMKRIQTDIDTINGFNSTPGNGITRLTFSQEYQVKMISGAGHDTALVAGLTEAGMIFVPSRDGRSHCPQEYTRMEDIVLGCQILLDTVVELSA